MGFASLNPSYVDLLPHLPGVSLDPVHRLGFAGEALDQPLVALAIADDHVPACPACLPVRPAASVAWAKARSAVPTLFI